MAIDARPRVLILGASGQIGSALTAAILDSGKFELLAATSSGKLPTAETCLQIDFREIDSLESKIVAARPNIVINAAAYTNVELAEDEPEACNALNHYAMKIIGRVSAKLGIPAIQYSTDYVYEGSGVLPQSESAAVLPISVYAESKFRGEEALMSQNPKHLIFRTSWIYNATGSNFPRTILRHALAKEELRVVNDQVGAPTSSRSVAMATLAAVESIQRPGFDAWGAYNLVCRGYCSWFDFAQFITQTAKSHGYELAVKRILPVPTSEYPTKAKRPFNSRLDISKFEAQFDHKMPNWQDEFVEIAPEMFRNLALPRLKMP